MPSDTAQASEHLERIVTVFPGGITQVGDPQWGAASEVFDRIREGFASQAVGWIRRCHENNDDDAAHESKCRLPVVCWSGIFSHRSIQGLQRHSGLMVLDIDDGVDDPAALRDELQTCPHIVGAFVSPRGHGVKAVLAVDATATTHGSAFDHAALLIRSMFGVELDPSGRDVSRACFLSHDTDAWTRGDATPMPYEAREEITRQDDRAPHQAPMDITVDPGKRHDWLVRTAAKMAKMGCSECETTAALKAARDTRLKHDGARKITDAEISSAVKTALDKYAEPNQAALEIIGQELAQGLKAQHLARVYDAGEMMAAHPPGSLDKHHPQVAGSLMRRGMLSIMSGASKSGKSYFALSLALHIAHGIDFCGWTMGDPCGVLVIDAELRPVEITERLHQLCAFYRLARPKNLRFMALRGEPTPLDVLTLRREIVDAAKGCGASAIFFDCLYSLLPAGFEENNNDHMGRILREIDHICTETQAAGMIVHHQGKGSKADSSAVDAHSGAGSIARAASCSLLALRQHSMENHLSAHQVCRQAKGKAIVLKRSGHGFAVVEGLEPDDMAGVKVNGRPKPVRKDGTADALDAFVLAYITDTPQPRCAIIERAAQAGMPQSRIGHMLRLGVADGRIYIHQQAKRGVDQTYATVPPAASETIDNDEIFSE
jgi:hypothetical protein